MIVCHRHELYGHRRDILLTRFELRLPDFFLCVFFCLFFLGLKYYLSTRRSHSVVKQTVEIITR